jgi:hypothetical protein
LTDNPYRLAERYKPIGHVSTPSGPQPILYAAPIGSPTSILTSLNGTPTTLPTAAKGNHLGMQNQQNQQTHHLEPPETPQENIKIEEEGKQMSKRTQRIAWNDLKPGDTIHVHGSSNTYTYKRGASHTCGLADSVWATASPLRTEVVIDRYDFNYATRKPEPSTRRHTRVQPPQTDGEYYLASIPVAPENRLMMELVFGAKAYTRILRASNARNRWRVDLDDGTWREYATWGQLLGAFDDQGRDVTAALTADEFYQRKYKQAA